MPSGPSLYCVKNIMNDVIFTHPNEYVKANIRSYKALLFGHTLCMQWQC